MLPADVPAETAVSDGAAAVQAFGIGTSRFQEEIGEQLIGDIAVDIGAGIVFPVVYMMVAHPLLVGHMDIAAVVEMNGGIDPLKEAADGIYIYPGVGLVASPADHFGKSGSHRVGQRLVVMGMVLRPFVGLVHKGRHVIHLRLQVQVAEGKGIEIPDAQLCRESTFSRGNGRLAEADPVCHCLAVQLYAACRQVFELEAQAGLLLRFQGSHQGVDIYDGDQVGELEIVGRAIYSAFKEGYVQPAADVPADLVKAGIFTWQPVIVAQSRKVAHQLLVEIVHLEAADIGLQPQEGAGCGLVGLYQAPDAVADELLVIPECQLKMPGDDIHRKIAPSYEGVKGAVVQPPVKIVAGEGFIPGLPIADIGKGAFLVVAQQCIKADTVGDPAPDLSAAEIGERMLPVIASRGDIHTRIQVKHRVHGHEKIIAMVMQQILLRGIEIPEHRPFGRSCPVHAGGVFRPFPVDAYGPVYLVLVPAGKGISPELYGSPFDMVKEICPGLPAEREVGAAFCRVQPAGDGFQPVVQVILFAVERHIGILSQERGAAGGQQQRQ